MEASKIIVGNASSYPISGYIFSGALPGVEGIPPSMSARGFEADIALCLKGIKAGDAVSPRIRMGDKSESGQPIIFNPNAGVAFYHVEGFLLDFHVVLQN